MNICAGNYGGRIIDTHNCFFCNWKRRTVISYPILHDCNNDIKDTLCGERCMNMGYG